ncbi:MAG: alpha/beta hydrolase, partial [Gammaproteobacteria bacterium]|nr:alpha/beta hydrolase [Gammaproteobacteria bacterium]
HDFEPVVPELKFKRKNETRFVFPHAPVQAVTVNGGMRMRAWYDIIKIDLGAHFDIEGIRCSVRLLDELVNEQIEKGIEVSNIVLAGFSQGGVIALSYMRQTQKRLAGVLALSTYFVDDPESEVLNQAKPPVTMMHGLYDPVVPVSLAQQSKDKLTELGYEVSWKTYSMQHSLCLEQIEDISTYFEGLLATQ